MLLVILINIIFNNVLADTTAVSIATNLGMNAVSPSVIYLNDKFPSKERQYSGGQYVCNFIKGCSVYDQYYRRSFCYPLGHRINYTYCSEVIKSQTPSGVKKYETKFIN